MTHSQLINNLLLELSKIKGVKVWKNHTGVAFSKSGNVIRFGLKGSADITGILLIESGLGVRLEIEGKTGTGRQSKEQKIFQSVIEAHGGIYIVSRSIADTVNLVRALQKKGKTLG